VPAFDDAMAFDVHVVSHTHWDREWYQPLERFRQRLVALIDELLDAAADGERVSFLLDGQTILIDDYLSIRPDRADELRALLRAGRLEAGPWYVLADELIPSGEALVRNLFAGRRTLARFDAKAPPVLYCPDSFGHPAALPALARGFGLPLILLWRGYGGKRWPAGDIARWTAPDGESVLLFHLPRDGYEFGSHLPADAAAANDRWQRMRRELVARSTTGVMLIQNGADHHARQPRFDEAIMALEQAGAADGVHRSSLRSFSERLVERSSAQRPPVVRGELRDSYGYTWTLQGTFATRAHEKRMNAGVERLLIREAEPWSALADYMGSSRRALVEMAWRTVLAAHPHDTLCGCSIDDVALAMEQRLRSARNEAVGIRDDSIAELVGHDPVAARDARDRWTPIVLVRNAAPRPRTGVAIIDLEEFVADVGVGPGSKPPAALQEIPTERPRIPGLGRLQVLSQELRNSRTESPRHYPDNDLVVARRVAAWVTDAPAYGIAAYEIGTGDVRRKRPGAPVVVTRGEMGNSALRVVVGDEGHILLEHIASGRRIPSLLQIIAEDDVGDLYTPAPRPRDVDIQFRGVKRVHRGPLRGELSLRYRLVAADSRRADVDLALNLVLDADANFLRLNVSGDNRRRDHRVRLALVGDVVAGTVWADAAFGPVRRDPINVDAEDETVEHVPPTAPLHRYVSVFGESSSFTVFSDGLAEYEARSDGAVIVTLLRAVGELSKNDLPERPGHAGWPSHTPGAQGLGPFEASLAVMLHNARLPATIDAIERAADDVLLPLTGETLRSALAVPPPTVGVELMGQGLGFSALKESEDGEWLVLRCVNLRDEEVAGAWRLPFDIREAKLARLDETPAGDAGFTAREIRFKAGPRAIVTVLAR
jgi:alpha-mannosidase